MIKKILPLLLLSFIILTSARSDRPAYHLFSADGKVMEYEDLLKEAKKADVIFFGELHDNPICHWLELELTKDLYDAKKEKLILGMEMFERDNQLLINEYLSRMIRKKDFEAEAKIWKNYATDYAPVVDFAREKGIRVIATNIPRRYAAVVNIKGFEGLDSINAMERGLIAPLPIKFYPQLECYKRMKEDMGGDASGMHGSDNIIKAQAIKDATMAHFILKNGKDGMTFLHFNGTFHSDIYQGIVWYLKDYNKRNEFDLKILTISSVEQESVDDLDKKSEGLADFILCIPEDMTKTQPPAMPSMMPMMPVGTKESPNSKADTVSKPVNTNDSGAEDDDDE
jgi:uncharacterized iron-regulated protein